MKFKTALILLSALALSTAANAAFTIDVTGNDAYDGQNPLNIAFTDGANSAVATFVPAGGAFNSNAADFGIGDDQIDGTTEIITITFDEIIEFNFIDLGGVGSDISDGANLTVAGNAFNLFTGVSGFNGSTDIYTAAAPITVAIGQSIILKGSSVTSSFDMQTLNVTVVPEPGTYALLGGFCALSFVMLRRRA